MNQVLKLLVALVAASMLFACSQGVVEEETPVVEKKTVQNPHGDNPHMENPHMKNPHVENPHGGEVKKAEKKIELPQEVADKYKSIIIETKNVVENTSVQTEVLIGQKADVTGTPLSVEVEAYIPDFVIGQGGVITTRSPEENNPTAKIKVYKDGAEVFDGWLYKNFPDAHGSFADPAYKVFFIKSVAK